MDGKDWAAMLPNFRITFFHKSIRNLHLTLLLHLSHSMRPRVPISRIIGHYGHYGRIYFVLEIETKCHHPTPIQR